MITPRCSLYHGAVIIGSRAVIATAPGGSSSVRPPSSTVPTRRSAASAGSLAGPEIRTDAGGIACLAQVPQAQTAGVAAATALHAIVIPVRNHKTDEENFPVRFRQNVDILQGAQSCRPLYLTSLPPPYTGNRERRRCADISSPLGTSALLTDAGGGAVTRDHIHGGVGLVRVGVTTTSDIALRRKYGLGVCCKLVMMAGKFLELPSEGSSTLHVVNTRLGAGAKIVTRTGYRSVAKRPKDATGLNESSDRDGLS
ncbi:Transcription elongation factor A protein 1 [Branchiostoma belcheri]|nr:Transcription elongation factor A protein 1 [Branchiostoma belcheri]